MRKKLSVSRETLHHLSTAMLGNIRGGTQAYAVTAAYTNCYECGIETANSCQVGCVAESAQTGSNQGSLPCRPPAR